MADAEAARGLLTEIVPEFGSGRWRLVSYEAGEARRKFGRRTVFCNVSFEDGGEGIRAVELVAKLYKGDRGSRSFGAMRSLRDAGFRPPASYRVPRPYGYSPGHGLLLQEKVRGRQWVDVLGAEDGVVFDASARAADWLVALHTSAVGAVGAEAGVPGEGARLPRQVRELAQAYPAWAPRIEGLARRLTERLGVGGVPLAPSHGDYHPENVFLDEAGASAIDFDGFGRRAAAFDVGYAVGQLLIMSHFRTGDFGAGARAALAFWRRYEEAGGLAGWRGAAAHVARAFLQSLHYELCLLRNGRVELVGAWTGAMEKHLESEGPEILEDLIRHS